MQRVALALVALIVSGAALAQDRRTEQMLKRLDPVARFEQICDLEAMKYISRDKTYRPEHTVMSALEAPKVTASTMSGNGAAFRSKGKWYRFSFTCETDADHMKVKTFSFKVGDPVPEEQWAPNGLW